MTVVGSIIGYRDGWIVRSDLKGEIVQSSPNENHGILRWSCEEQCQNKIWIETIDTTNRRHERREENQETIVEISPSGHVFKCADRPHDVDPCARVLPVSMETPITNRRVSVEERNCFLSAPFSADLAEYSPAFPYPAALITASILDLPFTFSNPHGNGAPIKGQRAS